MEICVCDYSRMVTHSSGWQRVLHTWNFNGARRNIILRLNINPDAPENIERKAVTQLNCGIDVPN